MFLRENGVFARLASTFVITEQQGAVYNLDIRCQYNQIYLLKKNTCPLPADSFSKYKTKASFTLYRITSERSDHSALEVIRKVIRYVPNYSSAV